MKRSFLFCLIIYVVALSFSSTNAATYYVDASRPDDDGAAASWATAKKTIQAAVNLASAGDTVLVTNGTYLLSSQITVNSVITLQSVNGPEVTIIDGSHSVRCVYLGSNAESKIDGFTVQNGVASEGGGILAFMSFSPVITNCVIKNNRAIGEAFPSMFPGSGGGVSGGTLYHCIVSNNIAQKNGMSPGYGGGVAYAQAHDCTLVANQAENADDMMVGYGGGAYESGLYDCNVLNNQSGYGGGASYCTVYSSSVVSNTATSNGGGLHESDATDCAVHGNSAVGGSMMFSSGGGMYGGTARECIISNNTAQSGGGVYGGMVSNCVVSLNVADSGGGLSGTVTMNSHIVGNRARAVASPMGGSFPGHGGGMSGGVAYNCLIVSNSTEGVAATGGMMGMPGQGGMGAGVYMGMISNCTVAGNISEAGGSEPWEQGSGGGFVGSTSEYSPAYAYNCIIWGNTGGDIASTGTAFYTCSPDVIHGENGCITNNPLFAGQGAFELQAGSPCIDAGNNAYAPTNRTPNDLSGFARISGSAVDLGAYEYYASSGVLDSDNDSLPDWWEEQYFGGPTNANASAICANGLNTVLQAYIAGLNPTRSSGFFVVSNAGNVLFWTGVEGRVYSVWWSSNLLSEFQCLDSNVTWDAGGFTDSEHEGDPEGFYKIDVWLEQ